MAKRNRVDVEPKIGADGASLTDDRKKQLGGYISEIERWEGQKATIQADIGLIFNAAKDAGFDTKAMRAVIKDRKKSKAEREAFDAVVDAYKLALGMLADTPLGKAAINAASPSVRAAVKKLGEPVPLTYKEKAEGGIAAFVDKDGTRMSISSTSGGDDLDIPAELRRAS